MSLKYIALIVPCIAFASIYSCQDNGARVTQETQTDSLSIGKVVKELDNKIWCVFQDANDHYWFGSNGKGIYRYDGNLLTLFTENDGLIDNTIRGIQADAQGLVYIETPHGISVFDGASFNRLESIESSSNTWSLAETDLWFHCNANLHDLYRYDGEHLYELALPRQDLEKAFGSEQNLEFESISSRPYAVFGLDKDSDGNLWIGTESAGAFRYDGKSFLWFGEKELGVLADGRVPGVRSMIADKEGDFWLSNTLHRYRISPSGSYEVLAGIDSSKGDLLPKLPYFMSAQLDPRDESLWMTTYNEGVWKYTGEELKNFQLKDGETKVLPISIYKDRHGKLWLGTDNAGAYYWNGEGFSKFNP